MAFGGYEWLLIVLVILMFFGAKRIPKLVRNIGEGVKEFRKTRNEFKYELDNEQQDFTEASKENPHQK